MQPDAWMTRPPLFLVTGLPWPEDDGAAMAEAALAIAPDVTQAVRPVGSDGQPIPLGRDLAIMLAAGSECAAALYKRVLFMSDITRWLADTGRTWEHIGVDFATAQAELEQQSPALLVTVSRAAYNVLCCAARSPTMHHALGRAPEVTTDDREKLRAAIDARLDADWPGYITKALEGALPPARSSTSRHHEHLASSGDALDRRDRRDRSSPTSAPLRASHRRRTRFRP